MIDSIQNNQLKICFISFAAEVINLIELNRVKYLNPVSKELLAILLLLQQLKCLQYGKVKCLWLLISFFNSLFIWNSFNNLRVFIYR
jgi:hypothetical protein